MKVKGNCRRCNKEYNDTDECGWIQFVYESGLSVLCNSCLKEYEVFVNECRSNYKVFMENNT